MSEPQTARSGGTRGRGGHRGGRGGFRGGRNTSRSQRPDSEQDNIPLTSSEEQGEVGDLKRKFGDKVPMLREVCPGWSDEDLVFALQETDGDIEAAVDRISSGNVSQWGEVKKKQPKTKDATAGSSELGAGRGRGRGSADRGRGRGTERGGRGARGTRAVSQVNGTKHGSKSVEDGTGDATATTSDPMAGLDTAPTNGDADAIAEFVNEPGKDALGSLTTDEPKPASNAAPVQKKSGGWAGLFAKPPPAPKPAAAPIPVAQPEIQASIPALSTEDDVSHEPIEPPPIEPQPMDDGPADLPSAPHSDTAGDLTPARDELTEKNLEKLPDVSHPPASATAASTVASTQDPLASAEPVKATIRPGMSGYAASAIKATTGGGRSASFARKVMEQQEAVVMPGNHAVEKTAVQFGKMGMNDSDDVDVDEDREEPETRTQLPDDSPAAPRASLPPAMPEPQAATSPQVQAQPQAQSEVSQAPRQAPGLPPAPQQPQQAQQSSPPSASAYTDAYRYGQGQKAYDPFGQQQGPTQGQTQNQTQNQEPFSNQVPNQSQQGASQNEYANYYGREAYQNYYATYGQGQDAQRSGSAVGTSGQDAAGQYATARPHAGYSQAEASGSGHNTPAPSHPSHQAHHSQHTASSGHAGYPYGGYPYNQQYYGGQGQSYMGQGGRTAQNYMNQMSHQYGANRPMFDDVRRQDSDYYANQYGYGQNQQYGGNYKSNMYGQQPQQYSYEHSSSPANAGAFGAREGYGRSGSTQPSDGQQSSGAAAFGGAPDPFGRSSSGFGQAQGMSAQHGSHQGSEEAKAAGPSPSIQSGRPGSAANTTQGQQGLPPPQSQHSGQQGFGGYPQYGGLGSFGHQTGHQTAGYGGYGSNAFGSYGGYGGGRGWNGANYGSNH